MPSQADDDEAAMMVAYRKKIGEHLQQLLTARPKDVQASERYSKDNRELYIIKKHPFPWHVGEEHESKADIYDANGRTVATIVPGHFGVGDPSPGDVCRVLIAALNLAIDLEASHHV